MAIRFYRDQDTGLDYYTAICDRCLRIGPTRDNPQASMTEGGFVDVEELNGHAIIVCEGEPCPLAEDDRISAEPDPDLSRLWRESRTPTLQEDIAREIDHDVMLPKVTHVSSRGGCPACGYRPTSWDIVAGRGPYEPATGCPECDWPHTDPFPQFNVPFDV